MSEAARITPARGSLVFGLAVALFTAILDQASKWTILDLFRPEGVSGTPFSSPLRIEALPILDFVLTWNRGVSFGMGNDGGHYNVLIFTALAVLIGGFLVAWMAKTANPLILASLGLIVGGAVGNVIDRLRFGAVVDFLYVHIGAFDWWPVFNVADSAVCIGAGFLVFDSLFAKRDSNMNTQ
ncbi:signal peptidase II [Telmatospirillum siberiense]|uniref:Lipoprotein signal peptidase n=1 Tax=Telmatospirillum siberiense TaxID=382514 RepID=A0A2N3PNT0_9PROT|nr:signal peptidase II [Telmatospirillum siberiense]PKU22040.1 signal peptidase II [Telmatospirillum siberiense]